MNSWILMNFLHNVKKTSIHFYTKFQFNWTHIAWLMSLLPQQTKVSEARETHSKFLQVLRPPQNHTLVKKLCKKVMEEDLRHQSYKHEFHQSIVQCFIKKYGKTPKNPSDGHFFNIMIHQWKNFFMNHKKMLNKIVNPTVLTRKKSF